MINQTISSETTWTHTGSSVSGNGYGYSIYKNQHGGYAVSVCYGGTRALLPCASFDDSVRQGERFADAFRAWQATQARELALSRGYAVIVTPTF